MKSITRRTGAASADAGSSLCEAARKGGARPGRGQPSMARTVRSKPPAEPKVSPTALAS